MDKKAAELQKQNLIALIAYQAECNKYLKSKKNK